MELTNNFSLKEFIESVFYDKEAQAKVKETYQEHKDSVLPNIQDLANQLQALRDHTGRAVFINIAYRPSWYEKKQGRTGNSRHTLGLAADIRIDRFSAKEVADTIEELIGSGKMKQGGLGRYNTFTHYDIGFNNRKRRWNG
jgi:uncharacterized protein YcbK (DUF882 family)